LKSNLLGGLTNLASSKVGGSLCPSRALKLELRESFWFLEKIEWMVRGCKGGIGVSCWTGLGPTRRPGPITYKAEKKWGLQNKI